MPYGSPSIAQALRGHFTQQRGLSDGDHVMPLRSSWTPEEFYGSAALRRQFSSRLATTQSFASLLPQS
ncbi:hypothetical protein [Enterobacter cloacae]|uniref:hypothetical protein n=1 Tax=Enterobacter cloacae TaxID=550 RepID=UPI0029C01F2E|nr:hypothetical protein [Enterobacter cloacae]